MTEQEIAALTIEQSRTRLNEILTSPAIRRVISLPGTFPSIVCLCGSTRFAETFHEVNLRETLKGNIVLSIGCDTKSDADLALAGEITEEDKRNLDWLHRRKIDLADLVIVLNVGGYVGTSTQNEIDYALSNDKPIEWLERR